MENESSDIGHSDTEPSIDEVEAKKYWPIPLFGNDAEMRIEAIKDAYGFNPNFDLLTRLREIRYELGGRFGYSAIAMKRKRQFAKDISDHAEALLGLLHAAHDDELAHLVGEIASGTLEKGAAPGPRVPVSPDTERMPGAGMARLSEALVRLGPDLRWLADRAKAANAREARRGRPNDYLGKTLVRRIRRVYVDAFGEGAARVSKSDEFSGKFFDFVGDVLPLFGEQVPPNNTLGLLVQDACDYVDKEEKTKSNSDN